MYNVPIDIMRVLIYNNIKIRNQKTNAEGNTMTYFKDITTLEELRKEYKRLVKINHPDNDGSADDIKIINVEYEIKFKILEKSDIYNRKKYNQQEDEMIRDIINVIIHLNIDIEICGSWIWVTGNTYTCKDELKGNGFHWASKKKAWYWHNPEEVTRSHGKTTMADIRLRYGSDVVKEANTVYCVTA